MNKNKKILTVIFVVLIVALGFFLRIYDIGHIPPGVYPDEAVNGMDALQANSSGHYEWFYPANHGREGLFINIQALSLAIFGISVFGLKLPSVIFGTLTVLGVFLLAKELFGRRAGLIASFLAAVSFWAINFSRIGFRAIMLPFVLVFSFYFLWKGLRTRKWTAFAAGGFIFGLGLHTYIAFRIAPIILVAVLFFLIISRTNFIKEYWKKILIFILFAMIAASPMFYTFFISHPEYLESRSNAISILTPEVNKGDLAGTFLKSFTLSLVKYNFWGDQNWRHNYPPYPLLDTLTGIAFLFGLAYSLIFFFRLFYARLFKKIRDARLEIFGFLIIWFFAMLVPEFMTAEGNPHALRSIGTLPVVFIFAALAFDYFIKLSASRSVFFRKIVMAFLIIALFSIGLFNAAKYFNQWAKKTETARAFEKNLMRASNYIGQLPPEKEKFVIAESMQRIPIQLFNSQTPNVYYFYPGQIGQIDPKDEKNFVIILTDKNDAVIKSLQQRFSYLKFHESSDPLGPSFYLLTLN